MSLFQVIALLTSSMQVLTLTKNRHDSTEALIQLVCTTSQPILSILSGFYMTLVVNVISWNKAYALFPQSSFIYHKSYLLKEMSDYVGKLLAKYDERGWKCRHILWAENEVYNRSMIVDRRIGDQHTWIIPLDTSGVVRLVMPDMVLEYSTFRLKERPKDSPGLGHYEISVMDFKSMVLKHNYATFEGPSAFWMSFAGPRLESLSFLELCKIHPSRRPRAIQNAMDNVHEGRDAWFCVLDGHLGRLQLPYYDSEIPEWYADGRGSKRLLPDKLWCNFVRTPRGFINKCAITRLGKNSENDVIFISSITFLRQEQVCVFPYWVY